jgi:hypothetical protein
MKDVILYEGILAKFILYISELYFICYGFSKFMNEQVQLVHIREPLAASFTHGAGMLLSAALLQSQQKDTRSCSPACGGKWSESSPERRGSLEKNGFRGWRLSETHES